MKKEVDPKAIALVLVVVVAAVIFFGYRTYTAPSAPVKVLDSATRRSLEKDNGKMSDAERKEFEEWRRTHPDAYTKQK